MNSTLSAHYMQTFRRLTGYFVSYRGARYGPFETFQRSCNFVEEHATEAQPSAFISYGTIILNTKHQPRLTDLKDLEVWHRKGYPIKGLILPDQPTSTVSKLKRTTWRDFFSAIAKSLWVWRKPNP